MKKLTVEVARKVLTTIDVGLVKGMGKPTPGKMCIEAAVCYALGEPHGDNPSCVGEAVRNFKIGLNDANWPSSRARALGMRRVGLAQLGSKEISQLEFVKEVAIETVKQIIPVTLRAVGDLIPQHKIALDTAASVCETVVDLKTARAAATAATDAAAAATDAARAAAYAAAAATDAAYAAAAATDAARDAATDAARDAADAAYAAYAATAAAYAAYAADAATAAAYRASGKKQDNILMISAEIAVQALIKLKCQGTEWLYLCD